MHGTMPFDATMTETGAAAVRWTCRGMLTYNAYSRFRPLIDMAETRRGADVELDLGALSFLDSNGLGMLLILKETAEAHGGRVRLVNVPRRVARMLEQTETGPLFAC